MHEAASGLGGTTWSITLPKRGATRIGAAPPRAMLRVADDSGETCTELPLAVGRVLERRSGEASMASLSRDELRQVVDMSQAQCARERIASLLDRREYSAKEVRGRLLSDGYDVSICDVAVARAIDCGLVDDARYADALIRAKLAGGWGRRRIEQELSRRGIGTDTLDGWPDSYLGDDEHERALAVARTRRIAQRNGFEKLVRYLVGRGYQTSVSVDVARQVLDEAEDD